MTATSTPTPTRIARTFETFRIDWIGGCGSGNPGAATWTGYDSRAEAQATVDHAATHGSGRPGVVVRKTFEVEFEPGSRHAAILRPGCGDRVIS